MALLKICIYSQHKLISTGQLSNGAKRVRLVVMVGGVYHEIVFQCSADRYDLYWCQISNNIFLPVLAFGSVCQAFMNGVLLQR